MVIRANQAHLGPEVIIIFICEILYNLLCLGNYYDILKNKIDFRFQFLPLPSQVNVWMILCITSLRKNSQIFVRHHQTQSNGSFLKEIALEEIVIEFSYKNLANFFLEKGYVVSMYDTRDIILRLKWIHFFQCASTKTFLYFILLLCIF